MDGADSAEDPIGEVVDEYLERLRRGERPAPSEYVGRHPRHAGRIREALRTIELVEAFKPGSGEEAGRADPATIAAEMPARLGDYRLLREVGRGGMGIVYEAEQVSLGRRVAIKVLPFAAALDPRQVQRFRIEAQAAALLHHPHIVPVFAVGREAGLHFYAMPFIAGRSLADLRAEGPASPPPGVAAVARMGVQAARALDHAHRLGVLHRDVKPANLLLDEKGDVWVADFGMARLRNDAGVTASGDIVGTLRYMSPEQARARRVVVDHRTDIYSLGATLYELLTGRPPFDARDGRELFRRIALEEPAPPRRVDPRIPRELETIVLKAMAKEPAARYATAQDLADDLSRFLEHRPVLATRPTPVERLAKWSLRHRTALASTTAVLVVAMALFSAMLWAEARRTEAALRASEESRRQAEIARRQERETLLQTFWTLQRMQEFAEAAPAADEQERARRFYREAQAFYDRITRQEGADPLVRAMAYHRLGFASMKLRQPTAEAAFRRSVELLQGVLAGESPAGDEARGELAIVLRQLKALGKSRGCCDGCSCCPPRRPRPSSPRGGPSAT